MDSCKVLCDNFNVNSLTELYQKKIFNKATPGLDHVTSIKFECELSENVNFIIKKVMDGKYKFTRYKKVLISKGEDKKPRVINISTIRDKLVLSALNECLNDIYQKINCSKLPHSIIADICKSINSNKYSTFMKFDISSFYSNVNHRKLIKKLEKRINCSSLINVIKSAIEMDALELPIKNKIKTTKRKKGIPEGLNISNSLANIYLLDLDEFMNKIPNIKYFRYIDDILILCNKKDVFLTKMKLLRQIHSLGLKFNDKSTSGIINKSEFTYLGYKFKDECVTVRDSSVYKFEGAFERLLSKNKYSERQNLELLKWRLNLKITGCIFNGKKYGWLFFFSQINDLKLVSRLDNLVKKLLLRYKINFKCKRFKRTFYEIRYALHSNCYIPNFDKYTISMKRHILEKIYKVNLKDTSDNTIRREFDKVLFADISQLEKDVQDFS